MVLSGKSQSLELPRDPIFGALHGLLGSCRMAAASLVSTQAAWLFPGF